MEPSAHFPYRLYLVVSEAACRHNLLDVVEQGILGGVDIVQLREKELDTDSYIRLATQVKSITDRNSVPLVINDQLEVAKAVGAFGIHVGNNDVSPVQIRREWPACQSLGYSIEYLQQLHSAEAAEADCFGISPVFRTDTKKDTVTEWGLDGIRTIRKLTAKPLIAIGNMQLDNVQEVIRAGADCIAVVSAICGAHDPAKAAAQLKHLISSSNEDI